MALVEIEEEDLEVLQVMRQKFLELAHVMSAVVIDKGMHHVAEGGHYASIFVDEDKLHKADFSALETDYIANDDQAGVQLLVHVKNGDPRSNGHLA